jgi:hypothetical protein
MCVKSTVLSLTLLCSVIEQSSPTVTFDATRICLKTVLLGGNTKHGYNENGYTVLYGLSTSLYLLNLLKQTSYVMHRQFNTQQFYILPTLYLCVLYLQGGSNMTGTDFIL